MANYESQHTGTVVSGHVPAFPRFAAVGAGDPYKVGTYDSTPAFPILPELISRAWRQAGPRQPQRGSPLMRRQAAPQFEDYAGAMSAPRPQFQSVRPQARQQQFMMRQLVTGEGGRGFQPNFYRPGQMGDPNLVAGGNVPEGWVQPERTSLNDTMRALGWDAQTVVMPEKRKQAAPEETVGYNPYATGVGVVGGRYTGR